MERRSFAERILTTRGAGVSPSGVARNSETWASDGASGTSALPKAAIAFIYRCNDSSSQTDLLIKHMRSHALRR
jgi:hypothetical protein